MVALTIVAILILSLFVIVPLIERSKMRVSDESASKISRWILPLVILLAVVQLIMLNFS